VHWKDLSPADATWESLSDFKLRFPLFPLEDKGHSKGEGVLRTYVRRKKTLANPDANHSLCLRGTAFGRKVLRIRGCVSPVIALE